MEKRVIQYDTLILSDNRKVKFYSDHKNTFGLRAGLPNDGGTCPGATVGKGGCLDQRGATGQPVCYAAKLRKIYKAYAKVEDHNTELLLSSSENDMVLVLTNTVQKWLLDGGHKQPYFRLHMSGDFFSEEYARAWTSVAQAYPDVKFWVYTRSMWAVPILAQASNFTIMLSADAMNLDSVRETYSKFEDCANIGIAYMGEQFPEDLIDDKEFLTCPEITGKLKNDKTYGACSRCRACVDRKLKNGKMRHIHFPIHR